MAKRQTVKKVSVRFVREARPKDGSGTVFYAGEVHELREDSAEHWMRRGYAVIDSGAQEEQEPSADSGADPDGTNGTDPESDADNAPGNIEEKPQ
ncbi:MAG: hypothetical protein M0Q95_11050 [Porticoccaceae bacterium]|nr:hypothetical protein [Porticoccaceae bacterium]